MHRERAGQLFAPQNQTVSAILVVGRVAAGERLFNEQLRQREAKEARAIGLEERLNEAELAAWSPADLRRRPLRVVVHDNPYARIPLPNELFRGPWDERYGDVDGRIQCRFRGVEIAKLP